MKIKGDYDINVCLEFLKTNFPSCDIRKKSSLTGIERIEIKKSFFVGSVVEFQKKKGTLYVSSRFNVWSSLFGFLQGIPSWGFVDEIKEKLRNEYGF